MDIPPIEQTPMDPRNPKWIKIILITLGLIVLVFGVAEASYWYIKPEGRSCIKIPAMGLWCPVGYYCGYSGGDFGSDVCFKNREPKEEFGGWQTYHNDEYGFEFRYPPHLTQEEQTINSSSEFSISFSERQDPDGYGSWVSFLIKDTPFDKNEMPSVGGDVKYTDPGVTQVMIGNKVGYMFRWGDAGCLGDVAMTSLDNKTFEVNFSGCFDPYEETQGAIYEDKEMVNKILASFKFTRP